jgi:hypothetical protein
METAVESAVHHHAPSSAGITRIRFDGFTLRPSQLDDHPVRSGDSIARHQEPGTGNLEPDK